MLCDWVTLHGIAGLSPFPWRVQTQFVVLGSGEFCAGADSIFVPLYWMWAHITADPASLCIFPVRIWLAPNGNKVSRPKLVLPHCRIGLTSAPNHSFLYRLRLELQGAERKIWVGCIFRIVIKVYKENKLVVENFGRIPVFPWGCRPNSVALVLNLYVRY